MPEFTIGFELIREPNGLLETGDVVATHTHNHAHNTDLTMGLWEVRRFQPVVDQDGKQKAGADGTPDWVALPSLIIRGGGPRSTIHIPANMRHEFRVVEGPAFYRCRFVHRDRDGNPSEVLQGYDSAYV